MISSFWNLCRSCPSVPVEKLHSEYRSTFQWHEYVGGSKPDVSVTSQAVVRQPTKSASANLWSGGTVSDAFPERRGKRTNIPNTNLRSNGWWVNSSNQTQSLKKPFPVVHGTSGSNSQAAGDNSGGGPIKSQSMGTISALEKVVAVPIHNKNKTNDVPIDTDTVLLSGETQDMDFYASNQSKINKENMSSSFEANKPAFEETRRKEYTSEYKKQFRPFSQYEYVDGRFLKKKTEHTVTPNPWYKEVIELRKKAGEYRYRGWGTELVPQHLADVYHQNVWDQVSRRSSLAALALITTTTQKSASKQEKDKENVRKSMPKRSLSRPNTATPKHPLNEIKSREPDTVQGVKKKYDGPVSRISRGKARSLSAGPGGRSPRKTARHSLLSKERDFKTQQRHPRPTTLATSPRPKASSDKGQRDLNSKMAKTLQFDQSSADPSLGFSEPVIKSPPEPTRVKSPEQVILRSPDPVNWTVPLDTTKTFTVTQNIRDAPPSPRFRAGDRTHIAELRGQQQTSGSGQHSSASTKASSPHSSFSSRSSAAPTYTHSHKALGHSTSKVNPMDKHVPQSNSTDNKSLETGSSKRSVVNGFKDATHVPGSRALRSIPTMDSKKSASPKSASKSGKPTTELPTTTPPTRDNKEIPTSKGKAGPSLQCLDDPQFMFDPPKTDASAKASQSTSSVTSATKLSKSQQETHPSQQLKESSATRPVSELRQPQMPQQSQPLASIAKSQAPAGTSVSSVKGAGIRVLEAPTAVPPPVSHDKLNFVPPMPVAAPRHTGLSVSKVSETNPKAPKFPTYHVLDAPDYPSSAGVGATRGTPIEKSLGRYKN